MAYHYLEFVCDDVEAQCAILEAAHGVTFGPPEAALGNARVAETDDGMRLGVRAPMGDHERPVVRPYLAVDDIEAAVAEVQAKGAVVAYGPAEQGDTGTWAIYMAGGLQLGLWQA